MRKREPRVPVALAPAALNDIDEAFSYIAADRIGAARSLADRLEATFERLGTFPHLGAVLPAEEYPALGDAVRYCVVEPYVVFYRVARGSIIVLRVLHARRDSLEDLLRFSGA